MKRKNRKVIRKYSTLLTLYLAQSIPTSFYSTAIPVIMRIENYSLESIGYIQLVRLPWIIKFLWAPLIDKTSSGTVQFKKWIIASELFYAVIIVSIGLFNLQTDFSTIIILVMLAFIVAATQDIATDAFAILILKDKEKSIGNSMQTSGNFIGGIIGSGVLLILYNYWGWQPLLLFLGAIIIVALIPLVLYRDHKQKEIKNDSDKISPLEFLHFFRKKNLGGHILLLFLFYTPIIGVLTMFKPYLVDLAYNVKQIAFISGIFGTSCGALMAIPAGLIIQRKGINKSLWLFAILNLFVIFYFISLTFSSHPLYLIYIATGLLWSSYAMSTVLLYTLGMKTIRKGREGTDFTIQIVIAHIGGLLVSVFSGKISDILNYRGFFMIEAFLGILMLSLLFFLLKKRTY